jgi:phospholipid/cholesterol/gamma-HCH transport system substrate-binding protein
VIAVTSTTPVRSDTKVGLEFQGLTGVPVIALEGGQLLGASGPVPTLIAEAGAGQSMTQAARDALRHVDAVLAENAGPIKTTIANFQVFSEGLARNTGKLDGIVAGLERMTGGGESPGRKVTYDLRAAHGFPSPPERTLKSKLVIPEPTAVIKLDTQRFLFSPAKEYPGFAEAMWADSIPKLLQVKLLESFENYDIAHAPLRSMDGVQADYQLLIDIRRFQIAVDPEPFADIGLSARILNKDGKVVAARLFQDTQKLDKIEPAAASAAFNDAFGRIARDMIAWTVKAI